MFLNHNISRLGKRNKMNLFLLYSLQNMSVFASLMFLGEILPSWINKKNLRPLQINYRPDNTSQFFIRAFYTSVRYELTDLPTALLFIPVMVLLSGFVGVIVLYGWRCGDTEKPGQQIEWDQIKVQKKMKEVKDLRIDDVINFLEGNQRDSVAGEYDMHAESFVLDDGQRTPGRTLASNRNNSTFGGPKKDSLSSVMQPVFTQEEDDARQLIENHFRGKPIRMIFDKHKGEITITYKNVNKTPTLLNVLFSSQMIYLFVSFCCSSVTPIFFINKLSRMLLTYLYTDSLVGPALVAVALISCIILLLYVLLLQRVKSKRFMIISYTVINYVLILLFPFLSQTLLGMIIIAVISVFVLTYINVLMSYFASISVTHSHMMNYIYPAWYASLAVGNILKVLIIDQNSGTFSSMSFSFLIIQGVGFLSISSFNLKKLNATWSDYSKYYDTE